MSDSSKALEGVRITLRKKSIFFCIGTFIMLVCIGIDPMSTWGFIGALIGLGIQGFPVLKAVLFGRMGDAIFGPIKADYEVVTTYGDGRKESDGGAESTMMNAGGKLIQLLVIYFFSGTVLTIQLIYLSIKGLILNAKASPKPAFMQSVLFIILINVAVTVGAGAVVGVYMTIKGAAVKAKTESTLANLSGVTLTVYNDTLNIRAEPSGTGRVVKMLNKGDTITATGNVSGLWVPVESGSDKGYVFAPNVGFPVFSVDNPLPINAEFPSLASTASTVRLMSDDTYNNEGITLERDREVTILNEGIHLYTRYFVVEYRNASYRAWDAEMEKFNFIRATPAEMPAEFNRTMPFDATVTENIGYNIPGRWGTIQSISAGEKVTVTSESGINGSAAVTYKGEKIYVHWKYLTTGSLPANSTPRTTETAPAATVNNLQQLVGTWIDDDGIQWAFNATGKVTLGDLGSSDYRIADERNIVITFPDGTPVTMYTEVSSNGRSVTLSYPTASGMVTHNLTKR